MPRGIAGVGLDSSEARLTDSHLPVLTGHKGDRRVLGAEHTTRKPMLLLSLPGSLLLRYAERQFLGLLIQEPPRFGAYPKTRIQAVRED